MPIMLVRVLSPLIILPFSLYLAIFIGNIIFNGVCIEVSLFVNKLNIAIFEAVSVCVIEEAVTSEPRPVPYKSCCML